MEKGVLALPIQMFFDDIHQEKKEEKKPRTWQDDG